MSAERLREAARLMRERAKVGDPLGYPSPWASTPDPSAIDGRHDLLRPGDDCGECVVDWCLADNGVECGQHDENGDRRG